MITKLLELLGLTAGQAGIGVMLIAGAIWARRAIIAGELVATGIRFGSVVAVVVGLGIVTGVISIDLSALGAGLAQLLDIIGGVPEAVIGVPARLIERAVEITVSELVVLLVGT